MLSTTDYNFTISIATANNAAVICQNSTNRYNFYLFCTDTSFLQKKIYLYRYFRRHNERFRHSFDPKCLRSRCFRENCFLLVRLMDSPNRLPTEAARGRSNSSPPNADNEDRLLGSPVQNVSRKASLVCRHWSGVSTCFQDTMKLLLLYVSSIISIKRFLLALQMQLL